MIPRLHGFEFCEKSWLPQVIREGFMDCLNQIHRLGQPYRHIAPVVSTWAERLSAGEILDLGSGGGGQVATVLEHMQRQGLKAPSFVLSDLYPDVSAWRALQKDLGPERVGFFDSPVAFSALPEQFRALTIFSAFHHLPPKAASSLLAEVVAHRDGICIVEFTRRTWLDLASMIPAFFLNLLAPLTTPRFRLGKLLLSPVTAAMVSFDGLVSALRSYSADEILAMLPPGTDGIFLVESGEIAWGRLPFSKSTYFLLSRRDRLRVV